MIDFKQAYGETEAVNAACQQDQGVRQLITESAKTHMWKGWRNKTDFQVSTWHHHSQSPRQYTQARTHACYKWFINQSINSHSHYNSVHFGSSNNVLTGWKKIFLIQSKYCVKTFPSWTVFILTTSNWKLVRHVLTSLVPSSQSTALQLAKTKKTRTKMSPCVAIRWRQLCLRLYSIHWIRLHSLSFLCVVFFALHHGSQTRLMFLCHRL